MTPTRVKIERILCPTDFSEFSDRALRRALALARWFDARLTVLHVIPNSAWAAGGGDSLALSADLLRAQRADAERQLSRSLEPLLGEGVPIEARIREGDPARAIRAEAEALAADLVVMGTHGRSGFERLLLGSVAEKLLRTAPCPVLTIGREQPPAVAGALFRRILCAADLTKASERTLSLGLSLAEENLAHVTFLHVVEGGALEETGPDRQRPTQDMAPQPHTLADRAMEQLMRAAGSAGSFCEVSVRVETGSAWRQIVRVAEETHADVVVLGAHAHRGLGRLFLGSTANQVVRHAPCPVLTVRETPASEGSDAEASAVGAGAGRDRGRDA
jgi:nucleotide-binding universal stress UspA family protein